MEEYNKVDPPRISVSLGYTKNMGDFESARMDFRIEDSTKNGESVPDAVDRIYARVEHELVTKMSKLVEDLEKD